MGLKVSLDDCSTAFENAQNRVLKEEEFATAVTIRCARLRAAWKELFDIDITVAKVKGNYGLEVWTYLEFRDHAHYIEWYLRWA